MLKKEGWFREIRHDHATLTGSPAAVEQIQVKRVQADGQGGNCQAGELGSAGSMVEMSVCQPYLGDLPSSLLYSFDNVLAVEGWVNHHCLPVGGFNDHISIF